MFKKIFRIAKGYIRSVNHPDLIDFKGVRINVASDAISPEIKRSIYFDAYEGEEIDILEKHLSPIDKVMELGAGLGFLSTYCAKRLGDDRVVAYEANPSLIPLINETYGLNGVNPILKNELLHDGEKTIDFYIEDHFWASSMVQRSTEAKKIRIKSININDEIERIDPTFLIMDIEGGEKEILPLISFNNIKKVIVELHPHVIGENVVNDLKGIIVAKGFALNEQDSKGNVYFFDSQSNTK